MVIGIICLTAAVICALVARVLLLIAAWNISVWWAVGVFLPFGPTLFRLSYPEEARSSYMFRLGTFACIFLYIVIGPGAFISPLQKRSHPTDTVRKGFASESVSRISGPSSPTAKADPRSLAQRRADNQREMERLGKWNQDLQVRKRDLLRSDVEGTRAYDIDLQEYQSALATATAEKQVLATTIGR